MKKHYQDLNELEENDIQFTKNDITKVNKLEKGIFNLKEEFGEFANTQFVKKQIDKFYNEMLKKIEK